MDTYGFVYRKALFPLWESWVRGRPTLRHLAELEESEWWSLDALEALQGRELRRLVSHAGANVPHFKALFRELGIEPGDVRNVTDLGKLPVMSRETARSSAEERRAILGPPAEITKMTSGTTGEPLAFAYDWGSEHWRQAVKLRGYGWAGYQPGDPSLHFWGTLDALYRKPFLSRAKVSADRRLRREHYVDCTERSPERLDEVLAIIERVRPRVLLCYSQAGVALARHLLERDRRLSLPLICGAERVFPHERQELVQAFGPRVFETYGSREFMLIATECPAHDGLHTSMENLIVELLVREGSNFRAAEPGEIGEVAITDLHNYGMPFIRYLNGDLAVAAKPDRCSCGRWHRRLASIEGRRNDTLHDGAGRPVSGLFFNVLFSVLAGPVRHFQVVQRRDRSICLRLVPGAAFHESVLEQVRSSCRRFLPGVDLTIELVPAISVERTGKLRVVVSEP